MITVINYTGRASELGGTVNLVDRRRSGLSRSERQPCRAKSTGRQQVSTIDMPKRDFLGPESGPDKVPREVSPYFGDTQISLQHSVGWVEGSSRAKNQRDSSSRFDKTPSSDRQTDILLFQLSVSGWWRGTVVERRSLTGELSCPALYLQLMGDH